MFTVLACITFIMGACGGDDEPENKQIYGTYNGTVHYTYTSIATGEVTRDNTLLATLKITQSGGYMNISIDSDKDFSQTFKGLPDLKVSGSSSYSYTYKSEDGNINLSIKSPDFNNITLMLSYVTQDILVDVDFEGKL